MSFSRPPSPRIQAFAAVSLKFAGAIRQALPVEGLPWLKAGEPEEQVFDPIAQLFPAFAACWWVPNVRGGCGTLEHSWQNLQPPARDPEAMQALVRCWRQVLEHYNWRLFIPGERPHRGKVPWVWPDVPPIPAQLLNDMERAARALAPAESAPPPEPARPSGPALGEFDGQATLSSGDLAQRYGVPKEALRSRLNRWRGKNPAGAGADWHEVTDRRPRAEKYLYRVEAVWPIILALKTLSERSAK
jgi:hypothetical protein